MVAVPLGMVIGAPLAVGLAGPLGLTAATMLATSWTHLRGRLIQAQRTEAQRTEAQRTEAQRTEAQRTEAQRTEAETAGG